MKHLEPTELELKMLAFHNAICAVLSEVAADVVVLRSILDQRGIIVDADYKKQLDIFGQQRLASYQKELTERTYSKAQRNLEKMKGSDKQPN